MLNLKYKVQKKKPEEYWKNAKIEAENKSKEEIIKVKEEMLKARNELDQEIKERRGEVQLQEKRIIQKEEALDNRSLNLERKEKDLEKKYLENDNVRKSLEDTLNEQKAELQRISGFTTDEAKKYLLDELEKDLMDEKASMIRNVEEKFKEEANRSAREIVGYAIQKCAADHTSETTVSVVSLPNDDMKGRIIGREGRNIKALETLTGIDLIIDDTPEAVILSGFDPLRREVAKIALEKLIEDGRIHPAKIEEMVEKAKEEVQNIIKSEGERAMLETGVKWIES